MVLYETSRSKKAGAEGRSGHRQQQLDNMDAGHILLQLQLWPHRQLGDMASGKVADKAEHLGRSLFVHVMSLWLPYGKACEGASLVQRLPP